MAELSRIAVGTQWTCEYKDCDNTFNRLPWQIKRNIQRFCSLKCSALNKKSYASFKGINELDRGKFSKLGEGRRANQRARAEVRESERVAHANSDSKKCTKCGEEKKKSEFFKNGQSRDGLAWHCRDCHSSRVKVDYQNKKGYHSDQRFKRHGISREIFEETLKKQGGGCAVCNQLTDKMCIDHNHAHCEGSYGCAECFRGVLCFQCNTAIGLLKEDSKLFQRAIEYCSK